MNDYIEIKNARIHNLKGVDVKIPKGKLTVITGVSGSGKSSLAFDTLYEEGRKRYLMFSGTSLIVEKEAVIDEIKGLSPTVAVEQRIIRQSNPRSTVGTRTQIETLLASLFANYGKQDTGYESEEPLKLSDFQKNSPRGMCPKCMGKGFCYQVEENKLIPDKNVKIESLFSDICDTGTMRRYFNGYRRAYGGLTDKTFAELTEEEYSNLMYGMAPHFEGLMLWIPHVYDWACRRISSWGQKIDCVEKVPCRKCEGTGLGRAVAHTRIGGRIITELESMYLNELYDFLHDLPDEKAPLQTELEKKLKCLCDVGLHHLSLDRTIPSLSGGEIQRLFLASYILAEMDSIIFVFDEPTIGLHENEKEKLISIMKRLTHMKNTVVCVEHDESFIKQADYIIDMGPRAGVQGGLKIYEGGYKEFLSCKESKTSPYLSDKQFPVKHSYRKSAGIYISIKNADIHNLKNVDVDIPLGVMTGISGASGSGKSSLIADTLVPFLKDTLKGNCITEDEVRSDKAKKVDDDFEDGENGFSSENMEGGMDYAAYSMPVSSRTRIIGADNIKRCYVIDQRPIGRSRTSCPATYTGIMDRIRTLYAESEDAKEKSMDKSWFSLNSKGKCRFCKGDGTIHWHVGYGNFIDIKCEKCEGYGFVPETMSVKLDGKTIREVLDMSVDEAYEFFKDKDDTIKTILRTLKRVGMGYIKLGQKTPTISGGESQRIKLAKELSKGKSGGHNLYILDEPTTGLSFSDSEKLLQLLNELVDKGNSIIITEHDVNMLSNCDWMIEMGPGGGREGGFVIAKGTPEELRKNPESIIGKYLK